MNTTSLELSKQLHELSGWRDVRDWWWGEHIKGGDIRYHLQQNADLDKCGRDDVPAYDLGHLLRKLPFSSTVAGPNEGKFACWLALRADATFQEADRPEDAAAMLAIELFKQGVLTRDGNE